MAEVIDFFSAWLDRKVAAVEKEAATVGNSWSLAVVVLTRVSVLGVISNDMLLTSGGARQQAARAIVP
jgi:uridine phosphorylase